MPRKSTSSRPETLLYADSESNADMLYFGKVFVPDPFIAFSSAGRRLAAVSQLEYARVKRESAFDHVYSMEEVAAMVPKAKRKDLDYPAGFIAALAKHHKVGKFRVGSDFPLGVARRLESLGVRLEVAEGMLLPERELKSDEEAAAIRQGNAASSAGFRVVERILREAEIRRGFLSYKGRRLTSEFLQEAIAVECLKRGAMAANTIVAGGDQACDPHCRGSGPLRPDQFIIVDIFPRVNATGYHGDMTRTYLKGTASDAQKHLYATVREAHRSSLKDHRSGKSARVIYREVREFFEQEGYPTRMENGTPVGFFHGLGHGLGLAVHEPPRVNPSGGRLRMGQVITVEPGLYYPGLGGVRIEDVVRVGKEGPEMLSRHGYRWHIR